MKGLEHSLEAEFCLSVHLSISLSHYGDILHLSINLLSYLGSFSDLQAVLWEGRKYTCYLCTNKVVPATLGQPSQVTKRRVTQLMRNAIVRSMRHMPCQCQPMVSGGHTHKAVNKATLTDRYILLLDVWHIWQRHPAWSHNPLWCFHCNLQVLDKLPYSWVYKYHA